MTYEAFKKQVLQLDGVTYVGPPDQPSVGAESDLWAVRLRQIISPSIAIFVSGPIVVLPPKHPGVQVYENIMKDTKP